MLDLQETDEEQFTSFNCAAIILYVTNQQNLIVSDLSICIL